jgi:hypothetical protein
MEVFTMATETIDSIHQAFVDWRKSHLKGPYPTKLKRHAMATLSQNDLADLVRRLGLSAASLKTWRGTAEPSVSGAKPNAKQDKSIFYEVPASLLAQEASGCVDVAPQLELEMQQGHVLRLRGPVSATLLRELVMVLQREEVAA